MQSAETAAHSSILYLPEQNTLLAATYNMGIFKSDKNAANWEHVLFLAKDEPIFCLFETSTGTILAGGAGVIYRSITNGNKWELLPVPMRDVQKIAEDGEGTLYAYSSAAEGIYKSADGGLNWLPYNTGLAVLDVNGLLSDKEGNVFCSTIEGETSGTGGLYQLDAASDSWKKKSIKLMLDGETYTLKVVSITSMATSAQGEIIISVDGVILNFSYPGILKNTIEGAAREDLWQLETENAALEQPMHTMMDELFVTSNRHIFGGRTSTSTAGIYAKLQYMPDWNFYIDGIDPVAQVKGIFCELEDGSVLLTTTFSNQLYITHETVAGKKVQQISFKLPERMKLYEETNLEASATSGKTVKFKSMNSNKAYIQGNHLRATGLYDAGVKAYIDGDSEYYYSEVIKPLYIEKAENIITLEGVRDITDGETMEIRSIASSGFPAQIQITMGTARFEGNTLVYEQPGPVQFIATEPGNETYAPADPLTVYFCIFPKQPQFSVIENPVNNKIMLRSELASGNVWYLNGKPLHYGGQEIEATNTGLYQLQHMADGCGSELSEPYLTTGLNDSLALALTVYPVPFSDKLMLQRNESLKGRKLSISLADTRGISIMERSIPETEIYQLETKTLAPGMYMLTVRDEQKVARYKIFKASGQ